MDGPREVTLKIPELGADVRRFRKTVLRVGRFVDPETGEVTNFDRSDLADLAAETNDWIESGHKVFFPSSGDRRDAYDAKKNMGYWTNFTVEGDELYAEADVPDATIAKKIGSTIQNVCPYFADDRIEYVAACTNVVMGGMGGFVALSRSREGLDREGLDRDGFRIVYTFRDLKLTAQGEDARDQRAAEILLDHPVEPDATGQIFRRKR